MPSTPRKIHELLDANPEAPKMVSTGSGYTALHVACENPSATFDVIERLLKLHKAAVRVQSTFGELPLHCICRNKTLIANEDGGSSCSRLFRARVFACVFREMVSHLRSHFGQTPRSSSFSRPTPVRFDSLSLLTFLPTFCSVSAHFLLTFAHSPAAAAAQAPDGMSELPLHWICRNPSATVNVVDEVWKAFPKGAAEVDQYARTAVDYANKRFKVLSGKFAEEAEITTATKAAGGGSTTGDAADDETKEEALREELLQQRYEDGGQR